MFDTGVLQRILLVLEHTRALQGHQLGTSLRHACDVRLSQVTEWLRGENVEYVFQTKEEFNGYRLQPLVCH